MNLFFWTYAPFQIPHLFCSFDDAKHFENPEAEADYFKKPESRKFSDDWNRNTLSILPKVSHHASGGEAALCVRYQAEGQCRAIRYQSWLAN
jgi:hypothetical protein